MTDPLARRGFLRDLVGLPLVGGGLTLIGAPSAVARPVTPGMLATYSAWLEYERKALMHASVGAEGWRFIPCINPGSHYHFPRPFDWEEVGRQAQQRAPIVLAAVGCPLTSREAERQWGGTFQCR